MKKYTRLFNEEKLQEVDVAAAAGNAGAALGKAVGTVAKAGAAFAKKGIAAIAKQLSPEGQKVAQAVANPQFSKNFASRHKNTLAKGLKFIETDLQKELQKLGRNMSPEEIQQLMQALFSEIISGVAANYIATQQIAQKPPVQPQQQVQPPQQAPQQPQASQAQPQAGQAAPRAGAAPSQGQPA